MEVFLDGAGECEGAERDKGGWYSVLCREDGGFVLNDTVGFGHGVVCEEERTWFTVKTDFSVAAIARNGFAGGALASNEAK